MFPCSGSSAEQLSRLLKRLDEAKLAVISPDTAAPSDDTAARVSAGDGIGKDFEEIKKSMEKLQSELCKDKRREDIILARFQFVARRIDEILTRARDSTKKEPPAWETDLELKSKLKEIKAKISEDAEPEPEGQRAAEEDVEEKEVDDVYPLERKIEESSAWSHLKLVVDSFETQLKLCLFCLTVFPPNAIIKKRLLFHWWMGEGIINNTKQGKKCFQKLVDKGFVIPIVKEHCQKAHYCKIQTWIRRLLIAVARSNAFLEYDPSSFPSVDYSRSRRACLRLKLSLKGVEDDEANRRLKTIYNVSKRYIEFPDEWLINKGALTTMQLGRWKEQEAEVLKHHIEVKSDAFLDGLGNCRNLKYISFRGVSRIEKLPDQFDNLTNLVVLDLRACHNLEKLPKSVGKARKLEYLDISECYLLDQIPRTLSDLSDLEVFKGFIVGDYANTHLLQVSDLSKLRKLRKLSISTGREFRYEELESLHKLETLTSLTIIWAVIQWKEKPEEEQQNLGPSPDNETTEQPIDDGNEGIQKPKVEGQNPREHSTVADRIQEVSTTVEKKKPSTAHVSSNMDTDEEESDQVSSQKATPLELPPLVEEEKVQLPDQTAAAVEGTLTNTLSESIKSMQSSKLAASTTVHRMIASDPSSMVIPDGIEVVSTTVEDKKPSTARVSPSMDADENKSNQVSLQKATPLESLRVEKKKVQLPDQTAEGAKKSSKLKLTRTMTKKPSDDPPLEVIPRGVQKLDLQCYNKEMFPQWITPEKLPELKKLYIRGGKLQSLGDGKGWTVEVLRVRFLDDLADDWDKLKSSFPNLECVEMFRCKKLGSWPLVEVDHEDEAVDHENYPRYWFKQQDRGAASGVS